MKMGLIPSFHKKGLKSKGQFCILAEACFCKSHQTVASLSTNAGNFLSSVFTEGNHGNLPVGVGVERSVHRWEREEAREYGRPEFRQRDQERASEEEEKDEAAASGKIPLDPIFSMELAWSSRILYGWLHFHGSQATQKLHFYES